MDEQEERSPTKLSIREWALDDRPRERMLAQGAKAMSDAELIAILIRSGTPKDSALDLAKLIMNKAGNDLNKLAMINASDLMKLNGVGEAKALSIVAALELGLRRRNTTREERPRVASSAVAFELLRAKMTDLHHEEFWLLMLDRGLRVLDIRPVSKGGMHGTVADPKVIFREAMDKRASVVVLAHNHPSGQLRPSEEDIALTKKLSSGGALLDITVHDHLILGADGYFSFADNGMM